MAFSGVRYRNKLAIYSWCNTWHVSLKQDLHYWLYLQANRLDKIVGNLVIKPYVDLFSPKFPLPRWSVSYLLVHTSHTSTPPPVGCDLAGVAPVVHTFVYTECGSSDRENTKPNSLLPIESWHKYKLKKKQRNKSRMEIFLQNNFFFNLICCKK